MNNQLHSDTVSLFEKLILTKVDYLSAEYVTAVNSFANDLRSIGDVGTKKVYNTLQSSPDFVINQYIVK